MNRVNEIYTEIEKKQNEIKELYAELNSLVDYNINRVCHTSMMQDNALQVERATQI